ncbi:MAG: response regulator [Deltaproteobacteria bacterium]|jgi:DNA-binding response OmpR family regulator|nr:response regulator [Deltaproteobacteria bacterium]
MDSEKILVIEDDPSVCELLFSCLSKAGFLIEISHNGEDGLRSIEEIPPRLVILDLNLPGMNGLDVCRAMRRDPWMSKIPVLMLTGKAEEDDIVTGLEIGADDYMVKPFSPKLLVARVKALLRRDEPVSDGFHQPDPAAPKLLQIKSLGYCSLCCGDKTIPWGVAFSSHQRQLLAMLISSPDGRIAQQEVQLELWPNSSTSKARSSFDSLLLRARKTLDEGLAPFDSKQYLVVRRGILCLENYRVDALDFQRLARKGLQEASFRKLWQAELSFSSAFSLWQGPFLPADFGSEKTIFMQDELEQLLIEASKVFACILAEGQRFQEATKILRLAQRYNPSEDALVRLLYQLATAMGLPSAARRVLDNYRTYLVHENYPKIEIDEILTEIPQSPQPTNWLESLESP